MSYQRQEFAALITAVLADHPDWVETAISAINHGTQRALERAQQEAAKKDRAFLAALALATEKRVDGRMKAMLEQHIVEAIGTPSCGYEQKFVSAHANPSPAGNAA